MRHIGEGSLVHSAHLCVPTGRLLIHRSHDRLLTIPRRQSFASRRVLPLPFTWLPQSTAALNVATLAKSLANLRVALQPGPPGCAQHFEHLFRTRGSTTWHSTQY